MYSCITFSAEALNVKSTVNPLTNVIEVTLETEQCKIKNSNKA